MSLRARVLLLSFLPLCFSVQPTAAPPRQLTFAERVAAQRAIDRVRYSHQIGATRPFEAAVPYESTERRVREALNRSAALAHYGSVRLTGDDLWREAGRVARATRMPDRLAELYAALGDDPVLVQEVLLRPLLEARFARSAFEGDTRWSKVQAGMDERDVTTIASSSPLPAPSASCIPDDAWDNGSLDASPTQRWSPATVWTGTLVLVIGGSTVGPAGERYDPVLDEWSVMSELNGPGNRYDVTAVWTGSRMIAWGGSPSSGEFLNDGRSYDPVADSWETISSAGAPSPRTRHVAVWSGTEMLVWGGLVFQPCCSTAYVNTGGRYNPVTNTWTPTRVNSAPFPRNGATAVWAGGRMIIWGGEPSGGGGLTQSGSRYDPLSDIWSPMSEAGAATARTEYVAVSTGDTMLVWGGRGDGNTTLGSGARYDPATDTWTSFTSSGAPPPMKLHAGVWTGSRFLVWGGNPGGSYDPATDSWTALSSLNAPAPRTYHSAVWTGSRMVIWGGETTEVALYDPAAGAWGRGLTGLPEPRAYHTAVWTGSEMIVWGGEDGSPMGTGGRYDPALDGWISTSMVGAPSPRFLHTAVWTGSEMIVWGGFNDVLELGDGARYDPVSDTWSPMAAQNAPQGRSRHSSVWTGAEMIIWGGGFVVGGLDSGGRYDPLLDQWSPTTLSGAPYPRSEHTAVWTGSEMIIWGGVSGLAGQLLGTGAIYSPASDSWRPTSIGIYTPDPRQGHTAVWTNLQMIVWGQGTFGGRYSPTNDIWLPMTSHVASWEAVSVAKGSQMIAWSGRLGIGGRYETITDTWTNTSTIDTPTTRFGHTAVLADTLMMVWGGRDRNTGRPLSTGGLYQADVSADVDGDGHHVACNADCDDGDAAVYPGAPQVCDDALNNDCSHPGWPGLAQTNEQDDDGDALSECAGDCDDAHATVFPEAPGLCDGLNNDCLDPSWPAPPASEVDSDGDGWMTCNGDCAEGVADIHPGAPQLCNGLNDDCSDPAWPAIPSSELDADGDLWFPCAGDCDDSGSSLYPGAPEICDGVVNNCSRPGWPSPTGTNEEDDDGDSFSECGGDCNDAESRAWGPASEVGSLTFTSNGMLLSWSTPPPIGGTVFCYDLYLTGNAADLPGTGSCLEMADCSDASASIGDVPPAGIIHYYLVRARTLCDGLNGAGSWGSDSAGTPRAVYACN